MSHDIINVVSLPNCINQALYHFYTVETNMLVKGACLVTQHLPPNWTYRAQTQENKLTFTFLYALTPTQAWTRLQERSYQSVKVPAWGVTVGSS